MAEPGHIRIDLTGDFQRLQQENRTLKGLLLAAIEHSIHGAIYTSARELEDLLDNYELVISSDGTLVEPRVRVESVPIPASPAPARSEGRFTDVEVGTGRDVRPVPRGDSQEKERRRAADWDYAGRIAVGEVGDTNRP